MHLIDKLKQMNNCRIELMCVTICLNKEMWGKCTYTCMYEFQYNLITQLNYIFQEFIRKNSGLSRILDYIFNEF